MHAPTLRAPLTLASPVGQWLADPGGGPVLMEALRALPGSILAADPTVLHMVESLPLDRLIAMTGGRLDTAGIRQFLDQATGQ